MKTGPDMPGRAPDILFIAEERASRVQEYYLDGPAELVVEVVSPESRSRDRGDKYFEYEAGGVGEYWLIDPARRLAEFNILGDDGVYRPAVIGADGLFHSRALPGLWIRPEWLWTSPTPLLIDVLREWKLI